MKYYTKISKKFNLFVLILFFSIFLSASDAQADQIDFGSGIDSDKDGLQDELELKYGTDPQKFDTDQDTYNDGEEISHGYDPLKSNFVRLPKRVEVDLSEQRLKYSYGEYGIQGDFLISSGLKNSPTPKGTFAVRYKQPLKLYRGPGFYLPNTKWNLNIIGGYFIHGAYWHNNFGHPMSHGCVNVSYKNMEGLYKFADVGTEVVIHE
jgi:lipoprotein-anchoring transpeptidase ErfK/SrfK